MRISLFNSKELQAVTLRMKSLDKDISKALRTETKKVVDPVWREAVRGNVTSRLETRVLSDTARAAVSNDNVTLKAGGIGRSMVGGATPSDIWHNVEFGANREFEREYPTTSRKGNRFKVNRHTRRQFEDRNQKGRVVYPAAAEVIPRIASLWVSTIVKHLHDALEGK